jgi:hypothetical protein
LHILNAGTPFRDVFGAPFRVPIGDGACQHDFAVPAFYADAGSIHVVVLCEVFVDIFDDSFIRALIALRATAGK